MATHATDNLPIDWTQYSTLFRLAVGHTLNIEGGLSNRVNDRGGLTKYGISQNRYPHLDIRKLTKAQAVQLYWKDFWLLFGCPSLPDAAAIALFDAVVNHNGHVAVKMLQRAVGAKPDGIVGPRTIARTRRKDRHRMLAYFLAYRGTLYAKLATKYPDQRANVNGWMRRLMYLQQFILEGDFR